MGRCGISRQPEVFCAAEGMEFYGSATADEGIKIFDRHGGLIYGDGFSQGVLYRSIARYQFYYIGSGFGIDMGWIF